MELLEVVAASNILLCRLLIKLVQSDVGMLFGVDGASEVEGDIVHQEALQFLLEPQDRLVCLHVHV